MKTAMIPSLHFTTNSYDLLNGRVVFRNPYTPNSITPRNQKAYLNRVFPAMIDGRNVMLQLHTCRLNSTIFKIK